MWKYGFIVLIDLVTLEVWKCGNMASLSLSQNSGSVEMWKYVFLVFVSKLWKCGNVEMWKYVFLVFVSKLWKCVNVEICLHCLNLSNNTWAPDTAMICCQSVLC